MVQRNWLVGKANLKSQNISHERINEHKMKDRNLWNEQPKRKLNGKETSNNQLQIQQDQCSTSNIEFAPSNVILIETFAAISNNFDKHLDSSINSRLRT